MPLAVDEMIGPAASSSRVGRPTAGSRGAAHPLVRIGDAAILSGYLGDADAFDGALAEFAHADVHLDAVDRRAHAAASLLEQLDETGVLREIGTENVYRGTEYLGETIRRAHDDAVDWVGARTGSSS